MRTLESRNVRVAVGLVAALVLAGCGAAAPPFSPLGAPPPAGTDAAAVLSPISVVPLAQPVVPVLGADGRVHLAYEFMLANQSSQQVRLTSIATLDAERDDAVVTTLEGPALATLLRPANGPGGGPLEAGESGYLFLDATLAADAPLPRTVRHRFAMTLQNPADPAAAAQPLEFTGVPVEVSDRDAVVLAPPLRGPGWVVGNGCCDALTAHRGATLSIDGTVHAPERFAIDFVQLDATGRLFAGDPADNASFPYFGDEVLSAADGTVVAVQDGLPEQVPGRLPDGITLQTAGGNHVVIDIGDGRFAFYAHLQPGSLRVGVGDTVRAGDVLGLLGNSGNTDAPHLHFHVMDGPSPLASNGLPFVFTAFTGQGVVTDEKALAQIAAPAPVVPIDAGALAGTHSDELPLNLQVVDLG